MWEICADPAPFRCFPAPDLCAPRLGIYKLVYIGIVRSTEERMAEPLFLGMDGGGTTCRARLTDAAGRTLSEGSAGSANLTLGIDKAAPAIAAAADAALQAAGLTAQSLERVHAGLGLAGANVPEFARAVGAYPFGFGAVAVASDAVIACLGAHAGGDGAILILGTGSQGLALVDGHSTAIGGWGFALSDDASGAILGRSAVRAALLSIDGMAPATPLTRSIMSHFGNDPAQAVVWGKGATPRDYGRFTPEIFAGAAAGDAVALAIVREGVASVGLMLDQLLHLGARRIALMGGLAAPYRPFLPQNYDAALVEPQGDAMAGALTLARQGVPQ
jgi:glucosamine kinase